MAIYRLMQRRDVHEWDTNHAHTMIICAKDENEARELAKVCEDDRECDQLWDEENANIKHISLTKSQVIQVA